MKPTSKNGSPAAGAEEAKVRPENKNKNEKQSNEVKAEEQKQSSVTVVAETENWKAVLIPEAKPVIVAWKIPMSNGEYQLIAGIHREGIKYHGRPVVFFLRQANKNGDIDRPVYLHDRDFYPVPKDFVSTAREMLYGKAAVGELDPNWGKKPTDEGAQNKPAKRKANPLVLSFIS